MTKFLNKQAKTFQGKAVNVVLGLLVMLSSAILVTKYLYPWLYKVKEWSVGFQFFKPSYEHPYLLYLFETVLLAPLVEELFFRHYPLTFAKVLSKRLIVPTFWFTSMLFGILHFGYPSILIQGVGGLVLASVYIKNGYSYWSSVIVHALYNLIVFFL